MTKNYTIKDILDRVKVLNLEDVVFELKTIVTYYDSLYNDFEYEKICKNAYIDLYKTWDETIDKVYDAYIDLINNK